MELTKEEIVKNTTKFLKTARKYGILNEEFEEFLGEDLIKSPASTKDSTYNAFEGGLIDHILRVMKKAYKLNEELLPEMQQPIESIIKVVYLHQIGKTKMFVPQTDNWLREKRGQYYEFKDDLKPIKVSERSIYFINKFGIELTEVEYSAILNYDKDDMQSEHHNTILGDILKIANKLAIMESKFLNK